VKVRQAITPSVRIILLTIILFICFSLGASVMGEQSASQNTSQQNTVVAAALLLVCFLDACVLSYLILRSRWTGWKLIAAVWLGFYGTGTVLPQIEILVFPMAIPPGTLPRLLLMGFITTAIFTPLAVWILGKRKPAVPAAESNPPLPAAPSRELILRFAAIAAIYVCVYFTFGYFIAWRDPAVRAYYGGNDPGTFFVQMKNVLRDTPWLVAFQVLRGVLWGLIALPIIRMIKGRRWEAGLAVALLFSVVLSDKLLLPNPYMPEQVRMTHLIETASSNFLLGWIAAWLLTKPRATGVNAVAVGSGVARD